MVATVLNEYRSLPGWLAALERQSVRPSQFVIVDGGSTDGTLEMLRGWDPGVPVVIVELPGSTIAEARNHGIALASGEIIAITDAGTRAEFHWLERLVGAFKDPAVDVAAGFFVPETPTLWTRALAATTLPRVEEINGETFLPSSRSVAVRRAWLDAGFVYPEWLDYCEDLIFDMRLKRAGARFAFVPDAVVTFEPRRTLKSFVLQYFRYARGDGKAGLFLKRHLVRYGTYLGLTAVVIRRRPAEVAVAAILGSLYMRRPVQRLLRDASEPPALLPVLVILSAFQRLVGDVAKMIGYPAGLIWRWRRFGRSAWKTNWLRINRRGCAWRPPLASKEIRQPTT